MQALQRVHSSRSIGFSCVHSTSKAPSQPGEPLHLAGPDRIRALERQLAAARVGDQHVHFELPRSRSAQSSAARRRPDDQQLRRRT